MCVVCVYDVLRGCMVCVCGLCVYVWYVCNLHICVYICIHVFCVFTHTCVHIPAFLETSLCLHDFRGILDLLTPHLTHCATKQETQVQDECGFPPSHSSPIP